MDKAQATKIAEPLFKSYPDAKEFHVTSDGQAFFTANDAGHHANSLGKDNDEVIVVEKEEKAELSDADKAAAKIEKLKADVEKKQAALDKATDDKAKEKAQAALDKANEALKAAQETNE